MDCCTAITYGSAENSEDLELTQKIATRESSQITLADRSFLTSVHPLSEQGLQVSMLIKRFHTTGLVWNLGLT